jgi:TolB protein
VDHTVVVCEGPGRLSLVRVGPEGVRERREVATEGLWPCWSPDGEVIAVSTLHPGGREVRGTIELLDAEGRPLRTAHQALPGTPPVIAPRVPHYVNWAPGAGTLAFVAPGTDSLALFLSDRHGTYSSDRVASGAPLFFSWSPDGEWIAVHAGGDLSIYAVRTRTMMPVLSNAIGFRAPVFVGSRFVYATPSPPGVVVAAADAADPGEQRELGRFEGGVVLQAVAGDPPAVSVSLTREPDTGSFNELILLDPATGQKTPVARGPFSAAIWSPRGDQVAVVVPGQMGDGRYSVMVYDRRGHYVAVSESFVPSQDYRTYLGFFDQYLLSHALWSSDGEAFLCCGRLAGDGISWSFGDQQNDYVWYWRVARHSPFVRASVGDCAFFRPTPGGNGR